MVSRAVFLFAAVVALAVASPDRAFAQSTFPRGSSDNPNGPTVSPYLNLLQNNNQLNGMPTYQSLVKPLIEQRDATQRQGNALQNLQQKVNAQGGGGASGGPGTGHATYFMHYSHFYPAPRKR